MAHDDKSRSGKHGGRGTYANADSLSAQERSELARQYLFDKYPDCKLIKQYVHLLAEYDTITNYISPNYNANLGTLYSVRDELVTLSDVLTHPITHITYDDMKLSAHKSSNPIVHIASKWANYKRFTVFHTSPECVTIMQRLIQWNIDMNTLYQSMRQIAKYAEYATILRKFMEQIQPQIAWCNASLHQLPNYKFIEFDTDCTEFLTSLRRGASS
jgi:hypothetical protein